MSKITVIIVDDEPKCVETLTILLEQYYDDIYILGTASSMESALPIIEKYKNKIDILFLDIQMPGGDGFTLLQMIPEVTFKVIFTTAYDKYAIKAIKFSALDYLLKPIDNSELSLSIEKYRELKDAGLKPPSMIDFKKALQQRKLFDRLAIPTLNEIKFISLDRIFYFRSDNNYTAIHLDDKQHLISSKNIGYYEELLSSIHFFRVHNSCLVNLKKIQRYIKGKNGCVELENGVMLEVSVRRKEELFTLLNMR